MEYQNIIVSAAESIGWLRFNRPPVNALNSALVREIEAAFDWFADRDEVRVIILTGEGKAFVAGADIAEMSAFTPLEARAFARRGHRALGRIQEIEKPVIAAINGFALGGGCEIALACDIRVMAEGAMIGQPEVKLGLIPGFGGTQRLARLVGPGLAKELVFSGDSIGAVEALRIGLVNRVVPAAELIEQVTAMAKKIAANGPAAVRLAKTVINRGLDSNLTTGNSYEVEAFGVCFSSGEPAEGTKAFLEKRRPDWSKEGM
ncbi:MAG TPA: crotonase [candidate division WOR-3 bacterium]|uniref:Crotonase n=1 Tax=candidate division WOR-3 bacterium TaxID=2052148 RepID=A0A7V0T4U4_UNCW3|nr:crotonase [candidate division WOR-3 bacterium]